MALTALVACSATEGTRDEDAAVRKGKDAGPFAPTHPADASTRESGASPDGGDANPGDGTLGSCSVSGMQGVCTHVANCLPPNITTAGHCPGPKEIQCCTAPAGDAGVVHDAGSASCPSDMVHIDAFCIDRYEAPNAKGALPLAMQTAYDAETYCEARSKRLCTESEWLRACEGTEARAYPYGDDYRPDACNDDKTWLSPDWPTLATYPSEEAIEEATRLYQGTPSGSHAACTSADGIFDLTGNVAEWVVRTLPHANGYDHVMKGFYWAGCYGGARPSCASTNPAHPGAFRTYEAGFRCCSAPLRRR